MFATAPVAPPQHHSAEAQAQLAAAVDWLSAALSQLHSADIASVEQRRAAETALLQFQRSDAAWTLVLHLLGNPAQQQQQQPHHNLLLFAAQTLRTKINEQGSRLAAEHLQQLQKTLLQLLLDSSLPTALLRQCCLCVASLAALMPGWQDWLQPVGASLPWRNAVQLLHDVAEEGSSDWRHITVPGLTSSEKLSWATTTRDRFRSWSPDALQLLHSWLHHHHQQQQQQQQQQATVSLLECLTAWVKLGCLHYVPQQQGEATAQVGLLHIQSPHEEVVSAALGLLTELPEFAPEQLIQALEPHMLQVAAAAVRAAAGHPPDLLHAAAWASAFAAYTAAVPLKLMAVEDESAVEGEGVGQDVRQALLQVSALPHIHNAQLVCLPALHVWSTILGHESPASAARFTAAGGGSGGLSRASTAADAAEAEAAADVAAALAAVTGDEGVTSDTCNLPSCVTQACQQLLLQTACNCMLWAQSAEGREATGTLEASTAVHDLFLAVCCVLGQQQYLQHTLTVWGQQQHQHQQQQGLLQRNQGLRQVLECVGAAPAELRLHVAVEMAAAAVVQPAEHDTSTDGDDAGLQQVCSNIAGLLSHAASQLQSSPDPTGCLHARLTLSFCKAVQVWASYLAYHFVKGPGDQGSAGMGSLLQLLVGIAAQQQQQQQDHSPTRAAAAAAVRVLTSSALHLGWDKLYLGTPLLLQAVQPLSGVDSADQDLFASLSMCLAAVGAPEQELQELRTRSCQQLVQPVVAHMGALLQQLQGGQQWSAMGKSADAQLCQHMVGVRVVLEAAWQRAHAGGANHAAVSGLAPAAVAAFEMEEDVLTAFGGKTDAWSPLDSQPQDSARGDLDSDPAVQLVVSRLWTQLHALVVQHSAAGKFLQHYAKCCSKLLKLRPELLLRQQQLVQFVEVSVLGLVRPGGCGLGEPLLGAVELCCQQQGSALLLEAAPCINQAYAQLWALPQVAALQQPGQGDTQPDLTEITLKLSAAWVRHSSILQPSNSQLTAVLHNIISAAAACTRCCHKKVGSCALAVLMVLLATAAEGCGTQQQLQEVVTGHAVLIAFGALGALLVPSPLPRLQKVSSVLLELSALAALAEQPSLINNISALEHDLSVVGTTGTGSLGAPSSSQLQQLQPNGCVSNAQASASGAQGLLHSWLLQAMQGFVPAPLSAQEAADLAAACAGLLVSTPQGRPAGMDGVSADGNGSRCRQVPASRSYVAARRLKRRLRDFAEKHMRSCAQTQ